MWLASLHKIRRRAGGRLFVLTALWRVLPLAPHLPKEESCVKLSSRPLLDLMPSVSCFVPLHTSNLVMKLFYPFIRGCPTISCIALPDHAKHVSVDEFMIINTLRNRPIPPHPNGWGLLGQRVETVNYHVVRLEKLYKL